VIELNSFFDKDVSPVDTIIFHAIVLRAPVSTIEKIKRGILRNGAEIVFQKASGNYLYITEVKPL
jgi:hypothetical protein